ncbi:MAG: UDP-N-acetylmuramoyl-L-alanine--D-glutamate ligase [Patescibacteria group bacterium]
MKFKGKKVLMVGLGLQGGGVATVKWLVRAGAKVTVTDLKTSQQLRISLRKLRGYRVSYVLGKNPPSLLKGQDLLVQNPAVPNNSPLIKLALKKKIPIENEASLFFKLSPAPIIGVTGSKGKSTIASWLGVMFKLVNPQTVVAGNIRDQVMMEVLPKIKPSTKVILELSSWQLEGLARWCLSPQVALVTNILSDHLDRYQSLIQYTKAKANIFYWQKPRDIVVLNYDNKLTRKLGPQTVSKLIWFSTKHPVKIGGYLKQGSAWFRQGKRVVELFKIKDIQLQGQHNLVNALAAATVAYAVGLAASKIRQAIKSFTGLHSRLQLVKTVKGVKYFNDTTATIPDACVAALEAFRGKVVTLIAGGNDKKLSYRKLAQLIKQRVQHLILLPGTATDKLLASLPTSYQVWQVCSMLQAVKKADQLTLQDGIVLLSPAASSFGLFINEWDRGEQFVKVVRALK